MAANGVGLIVMVSTMRGFLRTLWSFDVHDPIKIFEEECWCVKSLG